MRRTRAYGVIEPEGFSRAQGIYPGPLISSTEAQAEIFRPAPGRSKGQARYRPGQGTQLDATPVGTAGVRSAKFYGPRARFIVDDARKPAPVPSPTLILRSSLYQPLQRHHYQFHLNTDFGRVPEGQFPRGQTLLGAYAQTPVPTERTAIPSQRPRPRFTRVLRNPRPDVTPGVYR